MKKILNILLSLVFSICFFLVILCLTVFNKNFVYRVMDKSNYYDLVVDNIKIDMDNNYPDFKYKLEKKKVKKDIKEYVKSRYENIYFTNKINSNVDSSDIRDLYNKNIKFNNVFEGKNISLSIIVIDFICIFIIIITGSIFKYTKDKHDLKIIMIINFIISVIIYGLITLFVDFNYDLFNLIKESFLHHYIAISIILFEISLFKIIWKKKN